MLRNRRRASSTASNRSSASASASLAASKAFLRDRESNGALSSAAAAAALRTHASPPTPVGETVTKRMVRRGSMSSQGSERPGLRRHSSSGSMTERSFRAPSPARSSPVDPEAPPVPPVPSSVVQRRSSSIEPPPRVVSPAGRGGGRGVSLDRGTSSAGNRGRGQPRASALSKVVEDDQDGANRSSVNFSRPMSPASPAPRVASTRGGQSGWFSGPVVNTEQTFRGEKTRPKTSDGPAAHEIRQGVRNAADRPVSTRAAHMSNGVEGSRLASGSMRAKPSGTAVVAQQTSTAATSRPVRIVDPNSPYAVYDPSSRKFIHKQDAMHLHRAMSDVQEPEPRYEPQPSHVHQEAPQYSQPARQVSQIRATEQRAASASPVREASQSRTATSQSAVHHAVDPSGHVPTAFTAREFAEAEERLPADASASRNPEPASDYAEETGSVNSPKLARNLESPYPMLAPPGTRTPSGPPSADGSERSARTHSMSPPRNAHFAAVAADLSNGIKHQPPGRAVSPAKSALKNSPSVSGRSPSPLANTGRAINRGAPSETPNAIPDDGGKRKKKVRISFEDEPTVVGTSAYGESGPSQELTADDLDSEEDLDDILKPTPVLPSFGSIRDQNRRSRDDPEKVTETVSSSLSNSATLMGDSTELSRDHKIGGILAQDAAAKAAKRPSGNDPLPPEVTSVEGSGYYSESSESEPDVPVVGLHENRKPALSQSTLEPEPKTLTDPIHTRSTPLEVPIIAVQPASPPLPEEPAVQSAFATPGVPQTPPKAPRPFVPGGWDDDEASDPEVETKASAPAVSTPSQPSITIQIPERPVDDDSSDDNSSVYSDAYEDLEEGEGFGSIDAIMESPVVAPTSRFASTNSSPIAHKSGLETSKWAPREEDIEKQRKAQTEDWEKSQEYWSQVNASRKQQTPSGLLINNLASEEESKEPPMTAAPVKQTKAEAKRNTQEAAAQATPKPRERRIKVDPTVSQAQPVATNAPRTPAQPRKSALKKTTPVSPPPEVAMKKTMRGTAPASNGAEPHMRTTMRGASGGFAGRGSSVPASHRQSMPVDVKPPRGALQKKHLPTAAAGTAARPRPQSVSGLPSQHKAFVPPPATYESDSDASVSSFQRERQRNRASRNNNGGGQYTMRASMRSGPTPTMRAAPPVRSIPPPRTATSPPPSTLRKSMRPTSPRPASPESVKSSRFSIRSLSPGGRFRRKSTLETPPPMPPPPVQVPSPKAKKPMFGKASSSKASAKPAKMAKPFKSRINDSSDEEDDTPRRHFQSKFADSDSDDEDFELPSGLTPVRGIPRREDDGDSTDLEDEVSDNEPSSAPVTNGNGNGKGTATNGVNGTQGASLAAGSMRTPGTLPSIDAGQKKPKRGFFGFGKKKASRGGEDGIPAQSAADLEIPLPPPQLNRDRNRPLTPIGEDRDADAATSTRPPQANRPAEIERSTSDSWPLPSPTLPFAEAQRPQSADGPVKKRMTTPRPALLKRHSSQISRAHTEIDARSGKDVAYGRTGKKKKFQGLRRVLGIHD